MVVKEPNHRLKRCSEIGQFLTVGGQRHGLSGGGEVGGEGRIGTFVT